VHTLLGLSSTLLVVLGSYLAFGLLRRLGDWSQRRAVQCFVLAVPVVSLGLGLGGLHHFAGRACLRDAPSWDSLLGVALPVGMGLIALGALALLEPRLLGVRLPRTARRRRGSSSAMQTTKELPRPCTRPTPRASRSTSIASVTAQIVGRSDSAGESPCPGRSTASTSCSASSAGRSAEKSSRVVPIPCNSSNGSPDPARSQESRMVTSHCYLLVARGKARYSTQGVHRHADSDSHGGPLAARTP